jgi:uncharacterized repeat protein (TIGR03803 family)
MTTLRFGKLLLLASLAALLFFPARPVFTSPPQANPWTGPQSLSARYCVLYDFGDRTGDPLSQDQPAAIAIGDDGYLYSTSPHGGKYGQGTVFRVSPTDGLPPLILHDFSGPDGISPEGGLTRGSDGSFYGATYGGGMHGLGNVFRITANGGFSDLWDFQGGALTPPPVGRPQTPDETRRAMGGHPISPPVELGGTLYGVTTYDTGSQAYGILYQISGGQYQVLYDFSPSVSAESGAYPTSLSIGPGGSIWGVTARGALGYGTVFQVTSGSITTIHKFIAAYQGSVGVIQGEDGSLYGTAPGPSTSFGVVYRLNPRSEVFTVIHVFIGNDGAAPVAELTQAKDGTLYGITKGGGAAGRGVIYALTGGTFTFSKIFDLDLNDGRYAISPMVQHSNGDLYGITDQGGTYDYGVVYHLNVHTYPTPAHVSFYEGGAAANADTVVNVRKDVDAYQVNAAGQAGLLAHDGIRLHFACLRDPHIVQFVYRMYTYVLGNHPPDRTYDLTWGRFPLTLDPAHPQWHTDAIGIPNAYYEQSPGSSHSVQTTFAEIFDAPDVSASTNLAWQVTAKDFCICNCRVVRVVDWTRQTQWDATGKLTPKAYTNISIESPGYKDADYSWSNAQLKWVNDQLKIDGYDPVP